MQRVSVRITQDVIGKSLSRWVSIIGPIMVGGYSMIDTRSVGKTAIDTFSRVIEIEPDELP